MPIPLIAAVVISSGQLPARFSVPPILMYHRIDVGRQRDPLGRDLTVSPAAFAMQLLELRKLGLRAITMSELDRRLRSGASIAHTVVITFDDGYADQYSYALPLLRASGDDATFFLVTDTLGTPRHLTLPEIRVMLAAGMDIGGHGLTHDDLSSMTAAKQREEIEGCLKALQRSLNEPIASYAYPSGRLNAETLSIVQASGVDFGLTTDPKYVLGEPDRFELTRIRVHGTWRESDFDAALRAALAAPQTVLR